MTATCPSLPATPGQRGPETAAAAIVEAMSGSERAVLLRHLAWTRPDVVHAGVAGVAAWRAAAAERRRAADRRKRADRRRRQRAGAAQG